MVRKKKTHYDLNPLFLLINFFIQIGYIAKLIIKLPLKGLDSILRIAGSFKVKKPTFPAIKPPQIKIKAKRIKTPSFNFALPKLSLPKIRLPKLVLPKFKFSTPKLPQIKLPALKRKKSKLPPPKPLHFTPIKKQRFSSFSPLLFKTKYFILGILFGLLVLGINRGYTFVKELPSPKTIGKVNFPLSTHILDKNGKLLYEIYREQNRTPVKLDDLPKHIYQATIAFEDKDFFHHNGVSIPGATRAAREILFKKNLQGGSTITQQLVKSALLSPERTFERKFKEIILAVWTERLYSKQEILQMYLNQVPYGGSAYGIEEAAQTYFGKNAKDLTLDEAALLAGLPQAPSIYSPHINPDLAVQRRNDILKKMSDQRYITKEQMSKAQGVKLNVKSPNNNIQAPHFVFYIKSLLEDLYGIHEVEEGGLKVTTSLDLEIQEDAEEILKEELDKVKYLNITNGAILVTRPTTGEVLAMVGSYDYYAKPSGAFNVTTALRQPGSSIKPIMYALALEGDYTPATTIDDSPVVFGAPGAAPYRPVNYDGKFHGRVPLRYALANSYNIPAVKVLNSIGVDNFVSHARRMGITTWNDPSRFGLSLTLGGGEVKMTDMATAFGIFANKGRKIPVNGITKIEDHKGTVLYEYKPDEEQVLEEGVAYQISDILSDNVARQQAFGVGSALDVPGHKVAVKTGTTNDKKDNWTVGYTPSFVTVVWVGNNDNTPMNPALTSGITGAAPIWNRVVTSILNRYPDDKAWFDKPSDIVERNCYGGRVEVFIVGREGACGGPVFQNNQRINLTPARPTIR